MHSRRNRDLAQGVCAHTLVMPWKPQQDAASIAADVLWWNLTFPLPAIPRFASLVISAATAIPKKAYPPMAAPAKQAGSIIGKDIAALVAGRPRPKFQYLDLGSMAIVDGSSAVADLRGLKFSGLIGVLLWAGVHLGLIHDMQ